MSEVVSASGFVGLETSIALDSQGRPHVSFNDFGGANNILKYSWRDDFGMWNTETVASGGVGRYNSLALDSNDIPYISYYDDANGDLLFAYKPGAWSIDPVDGAFSDTGTNTSLVFDSQGRPHIAYHDVTNDEIRYVVKDGGSWLPIQVIPGSSGSYDVALALDAQGNPHIIDSHNYFPTYFFLDEVGNWDAALLDNSAYSYEASAAVDVEGRVHVAYYDGYSHLRYAVTPDSAFTRQLVATVGDVGNYPALALDDLGNPKIAYFNATTGDILFADASVQLLAPVAGDTWPVGSERGVTWTGVGPIDLYLSTNGGAGYALLASGLGGGGSTGGTHTFTVPHAPSRFCKIKIERAMPLSVDQSDSLFTIETDIMLLNLSALETSAGGGVTISWETDPGPDDLAGYDLERRGETSSPWTSVVSLTRETSYYDPEGGAGDTYRLFARNGLGESILLGESSVATNASPTPPLRVWPLPYRGGDLTITFATSSGPGGGSALAEVAVYDIRGAWVRRIASGSYDPGVYTVQWDGRDARGLSVPNGTYFIQCVSGGLRHTEKVTVTR